MESGPGGESKEVRETPEETSKVQRFEEKKILSSRRQILLLQRTHPFADEIGSPREGWGDERLMVLSELLPQRLSHRAPKLSRGRRALTRCDVRGLTATRGLALAG